MYLVIACHDTGHGPDTSPVCMTENVQTAYAAAMGAAPLGGYEFHSDESGVRIYRLEAEKAYSKAEFKGDETPLVFYRSWNARDRAWREAWCDDEAESEFRARAAGRYGAPRYDF